MILDWGRPMVHGRAGRGCDIILFLSAFGFVFNVMLITWAESVGVTGRRALMPNGFSTSKRDPFWKPTTTAPESTTAAASFLHRIVDLIFEQPVAISVDQQPRPTQPEPSSAPPVPKTDAPTSLPGEQHRGREAMGALEARLARLEEENARLHQDARLAKLEEDNARLRQEVVRLQQVNDRNSNNDGATSTAVESTASETTSGTLEATSTAATSDATADTSSKTDGTTVAAVSTAAATPPPAVSGGAAQDPGSGKFSCVFPISFGHQTG